MSNRCGWDFKEVIIHELLHAHDALLTRSFNQNGRVLLSDQLIGLNKKWKRMTKISKEPEQKIKADQLLLEWGKLFVKISNTESQLSVEEQKTLAREGIGLRWEMMGLDSEILLKTVDQWEQSSEPNKDEEFLSTVQKMFEPTPFKESAGFRTNVILAECKMLDKLSSENSTMYKVFTKKFDSMVSKENAQAYGKGYFEDIAEQMARSIQSSLDLNTDTQNANLNPLAKRWLVYADTTCSEKITQHWRDFFATDIVREAYKDIAIELNDQPTLSAEGLRDKIIKRKTTTNEDTLDNKVVQYHVP